MLLEEALAQARDAYKMMREREVDNPRSYDLFRAQYRLARVLDHAGQVEEAAAHYTEAFARAEQIWPDEESTWYMRPLFGLVHVHVTRGETETAREGLTRVRAICEGANEQFPYCDERAAILEGLILAAEGRHEAMEALVRPALATLLEKDLPTDYHPTLAERALRGEYAP